MALAPKPISLTQIDEYEGAFAGRDHDVRPALLID